MKYIESTTHEHTCIILYRIVNYYTLQQLKAIQSEPRINPPQPSGPTFKKEWDYLCYLNVHILIIYFYVYIYSTLLLETLSSLCIDNILKMFSPETFYSRLLSKNVKLRIYKTIMLPVVLYGCETWSLTLREGGCLRTR
jgi:hypothetical protein